VRFPHGVAVNIQMKGHKVDPFFAAFATGTAFLSLKGSNVARSQAGAYRKCTAPTAIFAATLQAWSGLLARSPEFCNRPGHQRRFGHAGCPPRSRHTRRHTLWGRWGHRAFVKLRDIHGPRPLLFFQDFDARLQAFHPPQHLRYELRRLVDRLDARHRRVAELSL